ncbi:MAG: PP2C family serine/threonine-protein phosphatase [Chloroflexota bacterium]
MIDPRYRAGPDPLAAAGPFPANGPDESGDWRLAVGSAAAAGPRRAAFEEAVFAEPATSRRARTGGWLGIVADSGSARPAAMAASKLAIMAAADAFYLAGDDAADERDAGAAIVDAVKMANGEVYRAARRSPERAGMATALTAMVIRGPDLFVAHVGDARACLIRDGRVFRVTRDDSDVSAPVQPAVERGAAGTRHLGTYPQIVVDFAQGRLKAGDCLMVGSDALFRLLPDADVIALASQVPQRAAEALVEQAVARGAPDSVKVVVACLAPLHESTPAAAPAAVPDPPAPEPLAGADPAPAERPEPTMLTVPPYPLVIIATVAAIATFWVLRLVLGPLLEPARPVPRPKPAVTASPAAVVTIATPVAAAPAAGTVIEPAPSASPTAAPLLIVQRPGASVRVRVEPRLSSTVAATLAAEGPRKEIQARGRVRGDTPTDAAIPASERSPVWYEIAWPEGSSTRAFIHCSGVSLTLAPERTCEAPANLAPPR